MGKTIFPKFTPLLKWPVLNFSYKQTTKRPVCAIGSVEIKVIVLLQMYFLKSLNWNHKKKISAGNISFCNDTKNWSRKSREITITQNKIAVKSSCMVHEYIEMAKPLGRLTKHQFSAGGLTLLAYSLGELIDSWRLRRKFVRRQGTKRGVNRGRQKALHLWREKTRNRSLLIFVVIMRS